MTETTPRIALSDRRFALATGRTLAQVVVELPAGFDALPITLKQREFRAALADAADQHDAWLERAG